MLYSREELLDPDIQSTAKTRYYNKFTNHRKEIKKLKLHEKEYLFRYLNAIIRNSGEAGELLNKFDFKDPLAQYNALKSHGLLEKAYDLYEIEESYEFLFNKIVLTYYHNLDFIKPVKGPFGELSDDEIRRDRSFFDYYFPLWNNLLTSGKGCYMTHLYPEYKRKLKILEESRKSGLIGGNLFKSKDIEIKLACYHIYYKVRSFFDNYSVPTHLFEIKGLKYVFDIYSYIHILSRHYMPSTNNFDLEKSFNDELPFIDIDNLPISFERLIVEYSNSTEVSAETEYFIFEFKNSFYIIWLKYGYFNLVKEYCMHVRTFYKIEKRRDTEKLVDLERKQVNNDLFFWI